MSQFPTPAAYAGAVLPFLHPFSHNPNYLHMQAVNECIEIAIATEHDDVLHEIGDALFDFILPRFALTGDKAKDAPVIDISEEDWISRSQRLHGHAKTECARLLEHAAIYGGQWAKSIREPDTRETRLRRMGEVGSDIIVVLRDIANAHGASLADVAALNYAKLADRNKRGVLMGDGSSR